MYRRHNTAAITGIIRAAAAARATLVIKAKGIPCLYCIIRKTEAVRKAVVRLRHNNDKKLSLLRRGGVSDADGVAVVIKFS